MTLHRFFVNATVAESGVVALSAADVHHLRDVLRLSPGDEIIVANAGVATRVRLVEVGEVVLGERICEVAASPLPRITLVQGLAKGEKMDGIVRQATELGVWRIIPFAAERSVVKLDADKAAKRTERWRRVALEAAKQSQRTSVPV